MKRSPRILAGVCLAALGVCTVNPTHARAEAVPVSGQIQLPGDPSAALLDLGNSAAFVDNATNPEDLVREYLTAGYNADPYSGIGDWNGVTGITSSDAIKSHNGPDADFKISVGYVNGAYANDPLIGGSIPGQESLPADQTLIRPALYGDLNLDGKVDDTDLQIFSGLGMYNQPSNKFGWLGGDLNYDGKVDDTDLLIFSGAGNYGGPAYDVSPAPVAEAPLPSTARTGVILLGGAALAARFTTRRRRSDAAVA